MHRPTLVGDYSGNHVLHTGRREHPAHIDPCGGYNRGPLLHRRLTHAQGRQRSRAEHRTVDPHCATRRQTRFAQDLSVAAVRVEQ
jgi:hypothetical protein